MSENMDTRFSTKYPLVANSHDGFGSWRLIAERTLALALDLADECYDPFGHVVTHHKYDVGLPRDAEAGIVWEITAQILISDLEESLRPKPPRPAGNDLSRLRGAIGRPATGKPEPKAGEDGS
jgi:hypothetical protein